MTITYELFTVTLIQDCDGFTTYRDFYKARFTSQGIFGVGTSREDAAVDLMRKVNE
jgi:hypothetical protein